MHLEESRLNMASRTGQAMLKTRGLIPVYLSRLIPAGSRLWIRGRGVAIPACRRRMEAAMKYRDGWRHDGFSCIKSIQDV